GNAQVSAVVAALNRLADGIQQLLRNTQQLLPLSLTGVTVQNGQLVANGLLGDQVFTAPLSLTNATTTPKSSAAAAATPVLALRLDPINLNLLGLTVRTSPICLSITAQPGAGNLLGNLLSSVAHLLDQGVSLGSILTRLGGAQRARLTSGLTSLL